MHTSACKTGDMKTTLMDVKFMVVILYNYISYCYWGGLWKDIRDHFVLLLATECEPIIISKS